MRPAIVPLLLVALLLVSLQPGVDSVTSVVGGDETIPDGADAVIVADGNVSIPADSVRNTSMYVIAGSVGIEGTLDGRLVQLAGDVDVGSSGIVTGTYQALGGDRTIADGATVDLEVIAEPLATDRTPLEAAGLLAMQAALLGLVCFVAGRRFHGLLANVGHSIRHHPVISGTVGLLSILTLLSLFVFMAFTVVLLPVSVLGILGGLVVATYAFAGVGYLLGREVLPDRPGLATAVGAVAAFVATRILGLVPILGDLVAIAIVVVAIGAVLLTYFGFRTFEPPEIRPVEP